jgi:hypothetical protein
VRERRFQKILGNTGYNWENTELIANKFQISNSRKNIKEISPAWKSDIFSEKTSFKH